MKFAFNAIVRNEAANIHRLLVSVLPHVDAVIITDTGSSDDTIAIVHQECKTYGVPCEVHHCTFVNFSQARNFALDRVRESKLDFTHILLGDADMELVVSDNALREFVGDGPAYFMTQNSSGLSYHNIRIVKRDLPARYIGVTHEYLDLANATPGKISGAFWNDYTTGANRSNKEQRDIRLLLDDLRTSPKNARSWFYLAQAYRDSGQQQKAINAYRTRISHGGWFEEVWHSQLEIARCYLKLDRKDKFVLEMIKAADMRPERAEPLYDLAKFYREAGNNRASVLFSKAALSLPVPSPNSALFVENPVYQWGIEYEYSIAAFYDERERAAGFTACDHVSLNATAPQFAQDQAKANLFFYTPMISDIVKSWSAHSITPHGVPDGYVPMNPSITARGNELWVVVRCVNYEITPSGHYDMKGDTAIRTRNFLVNMDTPCSEATELLMPDDWPAVPVYNQVIGFEDMRLFAWHDQLHVNACVRELNVEGWCEQVLARVDEKTGALYDWKVMPRPTRRHEKNWAPLVLNGRRRFMYRPGVVVSSDGTTFEEHALDGLALDSLSGGSQLIPYDGGWLAVVHESGAQPNGQRWYRHRFIWYDVSLRPARVSKPFCLNHKGIEFVAGLARDLNTGALLLSYGVDDREAWIGEIDASDVRGLLWTSEHE